MAHKRIEVVWQRLANGGLEATLMAVDECWEGHDPSGRCRWKGEAGHDVGTEDCMCQDCTREWDALESRYGAEWWTHPAWALPQPYPVLLWWPERDAAVAS